MPLYSIPDRQAFHDWLAQRLDRNVGRPARTASCPLATWLRQVNKNRRLHVCFAGQEIVLAEPDAPSGLVHEMPNGARTLSRRLTRSLSADRQPALSPCLS
jgi:hypothetical protein